MTSFVPIFTSHLLTADQLCQQSWEEILRMHFQSSTLRVRSLSPYQVHSAGGSDSVNSDMSGVRLSVSKSGDDSDLEDVSFVIKSPSSIRFTRIMSKVAQPFFHECLWYGVFAAELSKRSKELAQLVPVCYHCNCNYFNIDVPMRCERLCCFPCYLPCKPAEEGIILLENVCTNPKQFRLYDKHKVVDLQHVAMALQALAHFHGSWWQLLKDMKTGKEAVARELPCTYAEIAEVFRLKIPSLFMRIFMSNVLSVVVKLLRVSKASDALVRRFKHFVKHDLADATKVLFPRPDGTRKVLTMCHGDFWSNNMMFSYDQVEENASSSVPHSMVLLDFQMMTIAHPVVDILYFLHINTDVDFRRRNLDALLSHYFKVYTSYWDSESCQSYGYEAFREDYDEFRISGFLLSVMVIPNMLSSQPMDREMSMSEHKRKMERELLGLTKELEECPCLREVRRRIVDMVHEFDEEGYFSNSRAKKRNVENYNKI